MGISRKLALWGLLVVVILLAIFIDILPFINSSKRLNTLSTNLENLEKYTEINNKLEQKRVYYSNIISSNEKLRNLEDFLISNNVSYTKKENIIEFNGSIYPPGFKTLIELVQNSSDLVFLEFECSNSRELPIVFGKSLEILNISGKVKHLSTNRR